MPVETLLAESPGLTADTDRVLDLIYAEVVLREKRGERPKLAIFVTRFPALAKQLRTQFEVHEALRDGAADALPDIPGYTLRRELGRGGLGEVYEADEHATGERVAVKLLRIEVAAAAAARKRFEIEARVGVLLGHPGIVPVRTVGTWAGGPFLVLRLMEGGNLEERMRPRGLPPAEAVRVLVPVCEAAHATHAAGVIHRDLKPANVLFDATGRPFVSDFGLAKLASRDVAEGFTSTDSGAVLGTAAYMAPEQAGESPPAVAQDVYALGAVLFAALTGRPPFDEGSFLATLLKLRSGAPPPRARQVRPDIPTALDDLCARCLSPDPAGRYPSAAALAGELRHLG